MKKVLLNEQLHSSLQSFSLSPENDVRNRFSVLGKTD